MYVYMGAPLGSFSEYFCKMTFTVFTDASRPTENLSAGREDAQVNMDGILCWAQRRTAQFVPSTLYTLHTLPQ